MKRLNKFISLILAITIIANLCVFNVFAAPESAQKFLVFADFEGETLPDDLTYNPGSGSIIVEDVGDRRALYMDNAVDGSFTLLTKSFPAITSDEMTVQVDFMQPDAKSDGNIIVEMLYLSDGIFSVVTNEGNISALKADGTYEVLVSDYAVNTWYSIKVNVDVVSGNCDYYIDGTLVASDLAFRTAVNGADTVSSYARFTPGFYLDNFSISTSSDYGRLEVSGATVVDEPALGEPNYSFTAVVPNAGSKEYSFSATVFSTNGQALPDEELVWTVTGADTTGVSVVPSANTKSAKLKILPEAVAGGEVVVTVSTLGGTLSQSISISMEQSASDNVKIMGDPRVSTYNGKTVNFSYSAMLYDQLGDEIPGQSFIWELDNQSSADIRLSQDGTLTVSGTMPQKDEKVIITARLADDNTVFGQKSVLVQNYDTYYNDKQRLEAAIQGVDSIIKAASLPDGRNPLMGFYVSPYKNTYGYWNLQSAGPTAASNLTEQFELIRCMEGITGLTGDESYHDRVMAIYQWYLDHAIHTNGLVYWGNHQTMDLETGEWAEYFEKYATQQPYVEMKARDLYFKPFYELDNEAASKICIDHWCAIINDWTTMTFNRHAVLRNSAPDYSGFDDPDLYLEHPNYDDPLHPDDPWVRSKDLCFLSSTDNLINMAQINYELSEDPENAKKLLLWAHNLLYRYINTRDPETQIFGTLFCSPKRMDGIYSLAERMGREDWWNAPGLTGRDGNPTGDVRYGDRFFNQFGSSLVHQGYMTWEEAEEKAWEGALLGSSYNFTFSMIVDSVRLGLAMMEVDDPEFQEMGRQLIRDYLICAKSYIDIAYIPEQNEYHSILTDGTILDDVYWELGGYWGSAGKTFGTWKATMEHAYSMVQAYILTEDFPELEEERETLWETSRNICNKTLRMGDIGNPLKGERPNLSLALTSTDTFVLRMLMTLYEASGWDEYLTVARVIGNNIISKVYKEGYFIGNTNLQYIDTDGEYPYVLLRLEALLRGEPDLVPESYRKNHHECDAQWIDDRGALMTWDSTPLKTMTFPSVYITEMRLSDYELELKVGESVPVGVTIIPDDATSKAIYWDIRDRDIVSIEANNTVTALKEGETVAYAVSRGTSNMKSKPITIKVTR